MLHSAILLKSLVADFVIQGSLFIVAAIFKTEKFYDLAGSGTILLLAYQSRQWSTTNFFRQYVQTAMMMTWSFRLGLYLFTRIMKEGHDRRFNGVRENPLKFFFFWTLQAIWVYVSLLPTLILNSETQDRPLSLKDYAGWLLWISGFLLEVVADWQKTRFRNNPNNAGQFINTGLWKYSRHPNYLGEVLMSFGLYISASSVMYGYEYLSVLSPILITLLLVKISAPVLDRAADKRWASDPAYKKYTQKTPALFPFVH